MLKTYYAAAKRHESEAKVNVYQCFVFDDMVHLL